MLNFNGEKVKVWKDEVKYAGGSFNKYSISLSAKDKEGNYIKPAMYVELRLPKNCPELQNGQYINFEGFPTFKPYTDKNGKTVNQLIVVVTNLTLDGDEEDVESKFQEVEDDIPF